MGEVVEIKPLRYVGLLARHQPVLNLFVLGGVEDHNRRPEAGLVSGNVRELTSESSAIRFFSWPSAAFTNSWRCLAM